MGAPTSLPAIVALTGFMGAGKSTIGSALASLLHWRFVDLDSEIESRSKTTIKEIFAREGEPRFRELETQALQSILQQVFRETVIALGGGTFMQSQNAALLQRCGVHVVFLEIEVAELLQRCHFASPSAADNLRPLFTDAEGFRALYAQRLPFYRKANLTISASGKPAEQIAQEIAAALHLSSRAHGDR